MPETNPFRKLQRSESDQSLKKQAQIGSKFNADKMNLSMGGELRSGTPQDSQMAFLRDFETKLASGTDDEKKVYEIIESSNAELRRLEQQKTDNNPFRQHIYQRDPSEAILLGPATIDTSKLGKIIKDSNIKLQQLEQQQRQLGQKMPDTNPFRQPQYQTDTVVHSDTPSEITPTKPDSISNNPSEVHDPQINAESSTAKNDTLQLPIIDKPLPPIPGPIMQAVMDEASLELKQLDARRNQGETLSPEEKQRVEVLYAQMAIKLGNKYKTSEIEKWFHEQDQQLAKISGQNKGNALEQNGSTLRNVWNLREHIISNLKDAHASGIPTVEKNWYKGQAIRQLAVIEQGMSQAFPDAHKEKRSLSKLAQDIHKSGPNGLNERVAKAKASIEKQKSKKPDMMKNKLWEIYENITSTFERVSSKTSYTWLLEPKIKVIKDILPKTKRLEYGNEDEKNARKIFLKNCVEWMEAYEAYLQNNEAGQ